MTLNPKYLKGCVLGLDFEERSGNKVYDLSGNNNDGTIYGAQWANGKIGYGLKFDGVDDYIEIPHSSSLDLTDELTLMAWIYPESWVRPGTTEESIIIAKFYQYWTMFRNPGGLRFRVYEGGTAYEIYTNTNLMELNNFYLIAIVFKRPSVYFYINKTKYGPYTFDHSADKSTNPVRIGTWGLTTYNYKGIIDYVRIFNRALTQKEVLEHYYYGIMCSAVKIPSPYVWKPIPRVL